MIRCARLVDRRQGGSTMLMSCSGPVASEENVFPFPSETLDDVPRNESCRLADQLLLKLAGSPRKSELTPVDPWRSVIAGAVRRRSLCGTTVRLEGRTVRHLRPRRTLGVLQCVVSLQTTAYSPLTLYQDMSGAMGTRLESRVSGRQTSICASHCRPLGSTTCTA